MNAFAEDAAYRCLRLLDRLACSSTYLFEVRRLEKRKLTYEQIMQIRRSKLSGYKIAAKFGISQGWACTLRLADAPKKDAERRAESRHKYLQGLRYYRNLNLDTHLEELWLREAKRKHRELTNALRKPQVLQSLRAASQRGTITPTS